MSTPRRVPDCQNSAIAATTPIRHTSSTHQQARTFSLVNSPDEVEQPEDCDVSLDLCEDHTSESNTVSSLTSTLAITFQKILGESQDISNFDCLHVRLKSLKRTPNSAEQKNYRDILCKLQEQVQVQKSSIFEKFKTTRRNILLSTKHCQHKKINIVANF